MSLAASFAGPQRPDKRRLYTEALVVLIQRTLAILGAVVDPELRRAVESEPLSQLALQADPELRAEVTGGGVVTAAGRIGAVD